MAVNREQVLQSAEKLLSRGKLDQALKEYLRVLEDNPKDISTLNKVGDLYVRMNRPAESIPYFARIADFYSKDGFFLKAIAIYKKINKIDPAQLEVYDKLADLYHKQGLVQDARSQYQVLADHYQKNNRRRRRHRASTRRWRRSIRPTCGSRCGSRTSTAPRTRRIRPSCSTA